MPCVSEFKYEFFPAWRLQTSITTGAVLSVMFAKALILGQPIERPDVLLNIVIAAFCAACIAVPVIVARFRVTAEGLRTFSTFGKWEQIPWSKMSHVKPTRYYFLPHLRIKVDGDKRTYWLPLHLKNIEGLREAVADAAGRENPLFRALPTPARESYRVEA